MQGIVSYLRLVQELDKGHHFVIPIPQYFLKHGVGRDSADVLKWDYSCGYFDGFHLDDVFPAGHLNQSTNRNVNIFPLDVEAVEKLLS